MEPLKQRSLQHSDTFPQVQYKQINQLLFKSVFGSTYALSLGAFFDKQSEPDPSEWLHKI